jgi:TPR repeat protein
MKNLTATICLTIALLLGSAGMSWSANFQKGFTAAQSGDFATALREWTPLAEQGDAYAQSNLGVMYDKGKGVPQDYKTAVKWYRLAAEQGDAVAQTNLGLMYSKGRGVPQDHKTAAKWYKLAAKQGPARVQTNLNNLQKEIDDRKPLTTTPADFQKGFTAYKSGNYATALREWTPLAEQGNAAAQFGLGEMYRRGQGVPQDYKTAVKWYKLAAEQGYAAAQHNLGVMYALGRGVLKNYVYAHMWGKIAASNGNEYGGRLRDFVEKKMTPTDILLQQELTRECIRKKYKGC